MEKSGMGTRTYQTGERVGRQLYAVMLYSENGSPVEKNCWVGEDTALTVLRETEHCWYLEDPPAGIPYKCLKAREYHLISNKNGIYMFGTDTALLMGTWNAAVTA